MGQRPRGRTHTDAKAATARTAACAALAICGNKTQITRRNKMTKQQHIDAANEQLAAVDNALKEQYYNIATNIIGEIKSWFKDQSENCTIFVYEYLEATAPNYTPSVLCELSMALSETRRQLAEQRIQHEVDKRILKDRLNSVYGAKYFGGKLPKTPVMQFGDEVVDYALRQEQVKQAKIEVLNDKPNGWSYIIYIDDMIKELQNDT